MTVPDRDKTAPPAPDPRSGRNPGYAEPEPRDKDDARRPEPRRDRGPDEGGMRRKPDGDADPVDD